MKKKRPEVVKGLCHRAIERVDLAIINHQKGNPEDLNIAILNRVRNDLLQMSKVLNKDCFQASYGRFLVDWPDEHGLVELLLQVFQNYRNWT